MQGKGVIKFFLVVITLVCLLQYFYLLPTRGVENDAENYANRIAADYAENEKAPIKAAARTRYLDSMSNEVIFSIPLFKDFTYEELKRKQLALGLDLKGGMSTVLQVDLREFIRTLANDSKDPTFLESLETATQNQSQTQSDFVTLFADAFQEKSQGTKKLGPIFARNEVLRDKINFETPDAEVIRIIRTEADATVKRTFERLKERIDEFGVSQPNISLDAARNLILVELPGIRNPERARNFLQTTAELEFWDVYRITDGKVMDALIAADKKLKNLLAKDTSLVEEEIQNTRIDTTFVLDSLGNPTGQIASIDTTIIPNDPFANQGPLLSLLQLNRTGSLGLPVFGSAERNKMKLINEYLNHPEVKKILPKDLGLRWANKPRRDPETGKYTNEYLLYGIKMNTKGQKAQLQGDNVIAASSNPDPNSGQVQVSLTMNGQGAKTWAQMTTKAAQSDNREIAIVLDNKVYSAPRVNEPITGGRSQISGDFSIQEGEDLAKILQIGKLPAKPRIIQESLVGPTLGQENINRSINSLVVGFGLVLLFMMFYYGGGGIVSIIALFLNLFFIFGGLASFGTVLTLPGIAGIVLTIGMAVDANVIIYERIREELLAGKTTLMAIKDGFMHSYSAIIDANVTTILTAFVLAYFGMGPIKGFAVVLIIGVLFSLFTAVLVGRLMIDYWTVGKGKDMSFWTSFSKSAFTNLDIDWLGKRKIAYGISLTVIALGFASFLTKGFEYGVDFKGGYSYNIELNDTKVETDDLRNALTASFEEASTIVKEVDGANTVNVTTSYLINNNEEGAQDKVMAQLFAGVNQVVGGSLDLKQFKSPEGIGIHVSQSSKVGPTIADDIKTSSIYATIFALLLIFLYILIRFNKWQYSAGAVAALFHDTLVVLSIFSIFYGVLPFALEIDQAFIAAILTVIGYSINDTVVVFDRIRESMNNYTGKTKEETINSAVNSTVSRTIITSLTTLFVVAILFVFGGGSIKGFAFALLVGIIVGTYSSIFVAVPIMSDLSGEMKPREKKKKSSFSRAANKS